MTVIRLTRAEYDALPDRAHHAPDGTWINQPSFDVDGLALIEDPALTAGDEVVLREIAKAPEKLPLLEVKLEDAKAEKDELPAKVSDDLYAWRLDVLVAYPEAVAKIDAEKESEIPVDVIVEGKK